MSRDVLIVVGALLAAIVVAAALYWGYPWSRQRVRLGTVSIATFVAWILWRVVLQVSNADNLDVDNPFLLGLSAQDVGSGVLAFLLTALPMGLVTERAQPAHRVIGDRSGRRSAGDTRRSVHLSAGTYGRPQAARGLGQLIGS